MPDGDSAGDQGARPSLRGVERREEHAKDFALDYLPAYSTGLNPIERVWKLTRRRCLHNRCFPDLDNVIAASGRGVRSMDHPQ
ncbi:MAG: transposase [Acidobacteriia bacterium]|nr:transposase [Terriglobia bacterium]